MSNKFCILARDTQGMYIEIDLSQPGCKSAVLAAAGRFGSLARRTKRGGPKPKPRQCPGCNQWIKSAKMVRQHEKECLGGSNIPEMTREELGISG